VTEASLLAVEGVSKSFASGGGLFSRQRIARVVDDVSFTVGRGETFGLVGESGSGKSTIGRMITGLLPIDSGRIRVDGADIAGRHGSGLRNLRRRVQIVFQDPFGSLDPRVRIGAAIAEVIRLHRLRPADAVEARVDELLNLVGLSHEQARRFPHEFSGGQRQRIAIARALAVEPDLIVCDELSLPSTSPSRRR
jgi:ABC-type glutathione transport system ATPase component